MSGWRAALRLARRSVRRNLGRSLLIIALVALPVAGATVVDGLVRTVTDRDAELDRVMGTADARIKINSRNPFDVKKVVPAGTRAVPIGSPYYTGSLRLTVGDRIVRSRPDFVVLGDPLTAHLARLTSGRLPKNPDEALVTRPLAEKLGLLDGDGNLRPNATMTPVNGSRITVSGLAVKPYCLACTDVVALPNSVLTEVMLDGSPLPIGYLLDLPPGVDAAELARTWPTGESTIFTRDTFADTGSVDDRLAVITGDPDVLFAGLGLLGIVITAGAAFAVGARRQVRELALVAVTGGSAGHVRRIVLAQGLVLGVLGAAAGLLLGATATVLGVPLWQRMTDQLFENSRFGWGELAGAAALGVLASVVAATVPAFAVARLRPVDALAGRFRAPERTARLSLLGVFLALAGTGAVVASGAVGRARFAEYERLRYEGSYAPPVDNTLPIAGTLAGVAITVVGLVLVMPALLAAAGRVGTRLPLSGRLAVRDAVRHRHRTVAAGVAVMVAVAASTAAAFVFATRADTEPTTLPRNTALASLDAVAKYVRAANGTAEFDHAVTAIPRAVPGVAAVAITRVSPDPEEPGPGPLFLQPCPADVLAQAPDCMSSAAVQLGLGTPELIELAAGREPDARIRSALAEGRIVVFDKGLLNRDGAVTMETNLPEPVTVPAYFTAPAPGTEHYDWSLPRAFISAEAATARGWGLYADTLAITYPSPADLDAVRTAVEDTGMDLRVGEAVDGDVTGLYLLLAGVTGLVALLGAGVTVALATADGRADLAVLAALGAPPRRRRTLAGAHALVVTALGTLAGLVVGVCAGFAAVPVAGLGGLSVPWQQLGLTVLAVPLVASAVAALVTPARS